MRKLLSSLLFGCMLMVLPFTSYASTWSVFIYMCGSDLETNYGAATADIAEMLDADPSDEVTVIIQTGGAQKWQNYGISARKISRFMLRDGELSKLAELPQANMGDGRTLYEFLNFCQKNYAADHQVMLFWDHGGGSVYGLANDQNYNFDSISLSELRNAFSSVYGDSVKNKPFEIIGFDTCLMATVDTAASVEPYAKYMVASQEVEPGNGWEYTTWLDALASDPKIDAVALGKTMCDAYFAGCKQYETDEAATLSLIDLSKINPMVKAWNIFGMYALMQASQDDSFYATIGRAASRSENFSNSKSGGYTNMVDMGDFISRVSNASKERHPAADEMLKYLKDAVLYQVSGVAHNVSGLSCYYPYDSDQDSYQSMLNNGLVNSFILTYGLQHGFIDGETANAILEAIVDSDENEELANTPSIPTHKPQGSEAGSGINIIANTVNQGVNAALESLLSQKPASNQDPISFLQHLVSDNVQTIADSIKPMDKLDISSLEDRVLSLIKKEDGTPALEMRLKSSELKYIDSVRFYLATVNEQNDVTIFGDDIDMEQDWDQGVFRDNFNGSWPSLDGHLVYLETTADLEDYNYYSIPVILNGVHSLIEALYDFKASKYVVLGARRINQAGMPDKNLIKLKAGDKITTIMQKMSDGDEDVLDIEGESFVLSKNWTLEDSTLPDGNYAYMFSMTDVQGNEALSDVAMITIAGDEINYEVQ